MPPNSQPQPLPFLVAAFFNRPCGLKPRSWTLSPPNCLPLACAPAVDAPTTNGCTPLYIAANNGFADAAALLLELGADPDTETTSGCTPLHAGGWVAGRRLWQDGAGWGGVGRLTGQAGEPYRPAACICF